MDKKKLSFDDQINDLKAMNTAANRSMRDKGMANVRKLFKETMLRKNNKEL